MGCKPESLMNCVPKEDFGNGHPDPNLLHARQLVETMDPFHQRNCIPMKIPQFGCACNFSNFIYKKIFSGDGDADRNMIIGRRFFVTPSDSLSAIGANWSKIFPKTPLLGLARSMPTSGSIDKVGVGIKK